jgi:hypothetical protein
MTLPIARVSPTAIPQRVNNTDRTGQAPTSASSSEAKRTRPRDPAVALVAPAVLGVPAAPAVPVARAAPVVPAVPVVLVAPVVRVARVALVVPAAPAAPVVVAEEMVSPESTAASK